MSEPKIIILARGEEDEILSGDNPSHTFFTQTNKKYSYFGQNWNVLECPKSPLSQNCKIEFRLPVQGDLLTNMMLRIRLKDFTASGYTKNFVALDIINSITISHNGKPIATLDGNYIAIYHKLHSSDAEYSRFVDETSISDNTLNRNYSYAADHSRDSRFLHIPLPFWFTKHPGASFPIWLLDNPNITIGLELNAFETTTSNAAHNITSVHLQNIDLLTQYTNLTIEEKDAFKNSSLEYLIEQVEHANKQLIEKNTTKTKMDLPQTKFVKYIVWNVLSQVSNVDYFNSKEKIKNTTLLVNGNPIIDRFDKSITSHINRYNYFKTPKHLSNGDEPDLNIHTHTFSLQPNEFQSSGFLSIDKFNNFTLEIDTTSEVTNSILNVYLIKHNLLRFKDGSMDIMYDSDTGPVSTLRN